MRRIKVLFVNTTRASLVYWDMQSAIVAPMIGVDRRESAMSELNDIETLVRTHRARLLRFVSFSVGDEDLAATIVQDCFLKAYTKRDQFRGDSSVSTWLTTIAVNLVRDHLRTRKLQFWRKAAKSSIDVMEVASVLPDHGSSPETQLLAREKAAAVARILETLSLNQRTVFLMRFSDGMDLASIASATGLKLSTVKTHLHRAVHTLRERLEGAR